MKRIVLALGMAVLCFGCASKHPPIVGWNGKLHYDCVDGEDCSKYPQPKWGGVQCGIGGNNTACAQGTDPSQLTPVGCVLHTAVTFGHRAKECRKVSKHSQEEEKLQRKYYGKPYLDPPPGWHWVCSQFNIPSERCYIDKD